MCCYSYHFTYEKSESVVNLLGAHRVIKVIKEDCIPSSVHCVEALQRLQEMVGVSKPGKEGNPIVERHSGDIRNSPSPKCRCPTLHLCSIFTYS